MESNLMKKATILLVDDHAMVREGIRNALDGLPDLVVIGELDSGQHILSTLAKLQPDCLLIDITMPNFEPISAIRNIRLQYPELKILVVSAYDDDIYVQGLLRVGVNGYHLKDQPLNDFRLAVRHVLAGKRWVTGRLLDTLLKPTRPVTQLPTPTPRQRDILRLLQNGYDNSRIAAEIGISVKTVENHLTRLYRQLNVQSRLEAVKIVREFPELLEEQGGGRPKPAPVKSGVISAEKSTILVVDDNQRFRNQLQRMLSKLAPANTMIITAADIDSALRQARLSKPRLAFVDVVLGNENGIDCTRKIKPYAQRIILMSAYPDREFHRRGIQAGATAFLDKKDLDSAALYQIIQDTFV